MLLLLLLRPRLVQGWYLPFCGELAALALPAGLPCCAAVHWVLKQLLE